MPQKRIDVITCIGEINIFMSGNIIDFSSKALKAGSSEVWLHISSSGGSLPPAYAAYYHLRSLGIPIVTHNISNVESAAVILFLAGDIRKAVPHSSFLMHESTIGFTGQVKATAIRENFQTLEFERKRKADLFNERTQKGFDIQSCLSGSCRLDVAAAISAGIVTVPTVAPTMPAGAALWTIRAG